MSKNNFIQSSLRLFLCSIAILFSLTAFGQKIGVNERGDSIVVFNDGSWRYFDKELDQDLLKKKGSQNTTAVDNKPTVTKPAQSGNSKAPNTKSPKVKAPKNKAETKKTKKIKKSKVKKQKPQKVKQKKSKKKKPKKSKKKNSSKKQKSKSNKKGKVKNPYDAGKSAKGKTKKTKVPKVKYSELEEERFRGNAIREAEKASQEAQVLLLKYQDQTYDRVLMEDQLKDAYTAPNTTDEQIVTIEKNIRAKREVEDKAARTYFLANERSVFLNKLIDVSEGKRRKMLMNWEKDHPVFSNTIEEPQTTAPETIATTYNESTEVLNSKQALKAERDLRFSSNVYLHPPNRTCPEKTTRFNEFTGKKVVMQTPELFFTKTPEQMRILLKDREYFTCKGGLSNTGGVTYLELEIVIASTSAEKAYGIIEKGSKLSLKMIDGYTISLSAAKSATGEVNVLEKTVTYRPRYFLDKSLLKALEKSEIDQARLVWMTGYEDYEVFDVDFLSHQIACLKGK